MKELLFDPLFFSQRHLQLFWGKSADFWQHLWDKFLDISGELKSYLFSNCAIEGT